MEKDKAWEICTDKIQEEGKELTWRLEVMDLLDALAVRITALEEQLDTMRNLRIGEDK